MSKKKIKLARKQGLYLKDTGHKGRGVFCTSDIRKGEILEVTPTLILNKPATEAIEDTVLGNYVFRIGAISKALRKRLGITDTTKCCGVIMGVISYFNHAEDPNAEVEWDEHDGTLYHQVRALRRIPKNTEICTSYGGGWFDDRKDTIRRHK
ncbi:MAG: SET domain-containing protein-lysine N-methyltransferase [Alphaproteobacteria bacterium]|nr:SET domain-containing protein-lysine N-methyltransferase [Alphaproteobacteria bacterium]MDE2335685.1 SET domain-containing protein-lysine N-methyltransferase [Alphaproteobacteria bacterium]